MRSSHAFALAVLLLVGVAQPARAQEDDGSRCVMPPGAREATRMVTGDGRETIFISGPAVFRCSGGITVEADSAISRSGTGRLTLLGNVLYRDSVKTLTSEWASYRGRTESLIARGSVVLEDLESGSVIQGPRMRHFRATEERSISRTVVEGGRVHARLLEPDSGGAARDTVEDPMVVDSDELEIVGNEVFDATGNVEIRRGDTRGYGDEAEFDQADGRLLLRGDARVEDPGFELSGARIEAYLDGDVLHEVLAHDDAVLLGDDARVDAPEIRILFEDGTIHRLVARAEKPGSVENARNPSAAARRASVESEDIRLTADSIDALAPDQRLQTAVAIGNAYGERTTAMSGGDVPELLARDWIQGDTITGYFAIDSAAADDDGEEATDRPGSVLERLVAQAGEEGHAHSVYRARSEGSSRDRPGVNYIVARQITLSLEDGGVQSMEADGPIRGIHLQPKESGDDPEGQRSDGSVAESESDG